MARIPEISERKLLILSIIVKTHIKTGEPVGSKAISQMLDYAASSATIRNEMFELSELGLLEQPHTSAGRMPSSLGYRLFVDRLMNKQALSEEEKNIICGYLSSSAGDIIDLLEEAGQLIADLTGCAAIHTTPDQNRASVSDICFVPVSAKSVAVMLITDIGTVETKVVHLDFEVCHQELAMISSIITDMLAGTSLSDITLAKLQGIAASVSVNSLDYLPVITALLDLVQRAKEVQINIEGEFNLLEHREYDMNTIRQILKFINQKNQIAQLLKDFDDSLNIIIGPESRYSELNNSSIISAKYALHPKLSGTIGVIGPLRINYEAVIPRIEYIAELLNKFLSAEDKQ